MKYLYFILILVVGLVNCQYSDGAIDVCSQPLVTGRCKGSQIKFGFDTKLNKCTKFIYGGCGGNENRFDTLEDCEAACGDEE